MVVQWYSHWPRNFLFTQLGVILAQRSHTARGPFSSLSSKIYILLCVVFYVLSSSSSSFFTELLLHFSVHFGILFIPLEYSSVAQGTTATVIITIIIPTNNPSARAWESEILKILLLLVN